MLFRSIARNLEFANLGTCIPRNIRLAEAPSFGKPVLFHDRESRGALAYLALAGEMIRREEEERDHAASAVAAGSTADPGALGAGTPTDETHEAGTTDYGGDSMTSDGSEGAPFISDPHAVQTDS